MYYGRGQIRVYNESGETAPAYSFGDISRSSQIPWNWPYWKFKKPNADNIALVNLVFIPEAIPNGKIGVAYTGGIFCIQKTAGETIAQGDKVGTDENQWTAIKIDDDALGNNDGQFQVIGLAGASNEYLLLRSRISENLFAFTS